MNFNKYVYIYINIYLNKWIVYKNTIYIYLDAYTSTWTYIYIHILRYYVLHMHIVRNIRAKFIITDRCIYMHVCIATTLYHDVNFNEHKDR